MLKERIYQLLEILKQKNRPEATTYHFNKEQFRQYALENNVENIDIILKAIEQQEKTINNEEMKMDEDLKTQITNLFIELKAEIRVLKKEISNTKWILGILITLFGIFTPHLFSLHSSKIDAKFDAIDTKYDSIIQEIRSNRELNKLQIERDVIKEVSKQVKH